MKYINGLLLVIAFFLSSGMVAQELEDKTLFTIDGIDYDAGTFMKFYFKNIDIVQDEDQKDLDNYLDLYIDYRLKLEQAYDLNLDKKATYLKEIKSTRSSLAQSYLTDNEVSERLVEEAYERGNKEINASHILIKVDRTASPADSLKAWKKINEIHKELQDGANFANLAKTKSEGPSASNEGNLGWFGSFRMVYEFENAAFDTQEGDFSVPFRTDFGYHIVHVNDIRPNPGEITVAHIMTFDKEGTRNESAQTRIEELYEEVENGKAFEVLAREFSDDSNSAPRGGQLNKFSTGGVDEVFANAAFKLQNIGDYTKPFKTKFGWHIIKLLEKHPLKTYDQLEKELTEKIQKSPRSRKITNAFINKLKKKYGIEKKQILPNQVYSKVADSLLLLTNYVYEPASKEMNDVLFTIKETDYRTNDFLKFVEQNQKVYFINYSSKKAKLDAFYESYSNAKLIEYYDEHLERDNQDFNFIYNEFKEGFLVFDLIETQIWEKSKKDSVGLKEFYSNHKSDYIWKRRLEIILTQSTSEQVAKEVKKQLINKIPTDTIKSNLNIDNKTQVIISSGTVEENYNRLPDGFDIKKGVSKVYHNEGDSFYKVVEVKEIIEPSGKTFEEAKGNVINDYQQELERKWLDNLREGHHIKVHKRTLRKVRSKIESQLD